MAPTTSSSSASAELSSAPLADYFFIAGIESTQIFEERERASGLVAPTLNATIEEDKALDTASARPKSSEGLSVADGPHRRSRSRFSYEARKSVGSMTGLEAKTPASNRSSATVKGIQAGSGLSDADFEHALRRFAAERDTFLEEIQFSAGAVAQPTRPKPRQRTQRIVAEDAGTPKSGVGSIRRRISTMSSMKRQPSATRQCEFAVQAFLRGTMTLRRLDADWRLQSLYPDLQATQRLQLRHPRPTAFRAHAEHAPPETTIRASPARPISTRKLGRRAQAQESFSGLCPHVRVSQRRQRCLLG